MSNNLDLSQVAAAQNQKEVTINDQAGQLDAALTARLTLAIDSTNTHDLTSAELRRHFFFDLDPDAGDPPGDAITLTIPAGISRGPFAAINDTGFEVTVAITGQPLSAPTIADGEAVLLTSDGVDVRLAGGGAGAIAALLYPIISAGSDLTLAVAGTEYQASALEVERGRMVTLAVTKKRTDYIRFFAGQGASTASPVGRVTLIQELDIRHQFVPQCADLGGHRELEPRQ